MTTILVVVAFLIIPIFVACTFGGKIQSIKSRKLCVGGVAMASCMMVLAAYVVLGKKVTVYEYLLIDAVTAAGLAFVLTCFQKKNLDVEDVLRTGFHICMAVVIYSILTYGQTMIHGDTATASLLTKAQLKYGQFFPENWYYVNGDIWVISLQLFVAPFVVLLENQSLARMLGSVFLVVVTAWTIYLHSKKVLHDESWLLAVPLMFVFLAGERDMMLYQVAYTLQMVFLVAGVSWIFRVYEGSDRKRDYVVPGVFMALLATGGVRDVAEVILPVWLTCMVLNYLNVRNCKAPDWKQVWKEWIRLTVVVMVPAAIGLTAHVYLKNTLHMVDTAQNSLVLVSSLDECIENVSWYISSLFACFGFRGGADLISLNGIWSMCSVVMCCVVVFVVPVLQARKLKQESVYVQFLFAFSIIHNLIMLVLAVFLTGKDQPRYLLTSIFAWILVSARYIYVYWISQVYMDKLIWAGLFAGASVLGCAVLGAHSLGWEKKLEKKMHVVSQLKETGVTKGYGAFWDVCGYEIYSNFDLQFGPIEIQEDDITPYVWLIDADVFTPAETKTFLLLDEEENEKFISLHPEKFEEPMDYFVFDSNHVYIFDYDIARDLT